MGRPRNDDGSYCASPSPKNNNNNNTTLSRLIVLMAIMPVLAQSEEIINEFCKTSQKPMICTALVKGATKWEEAVKNTLESTIQLNRDEVQKMLPVVLHSFDNLPKIAKDSATRTCRSEFSNIDYNLKDAIQYWYQNDIRSLNLYLTACRFVFCKEAITKRHLTLPPQFSYVEDQLYWHIDTCLSVLYSNHK